MVAMVQLLKNSFDLDAQSLGAQIKEKVIRCLYHSYFILRIIVVQAAL